MKIAATHITITITTDEWKKIKKDWEVLKDNTDRRIRTDSSEMPFLTDFINCMDTVNNNLSHKVDKPLNEY